MKKILVVEDTQDNFDLIKDALEREYEVVQAATGAEGLLKAHELAPDLILLDMELPELDGLEVVRRLKEDAALCRIPVIALTAHAMQGHRERCLKAGCDEYLAKPISIRSLRMMVHLCMAARRSQEPDSWPATSSCSEWDCSVRG